VKGRRIWYLCGLLLLVAIGVRAGARELSVQVKEAKLRTGPSFLGQVVGASDYGARVEVLQEQGTWVEIRTEDGVTGWLHSSALTEKKVKLTAGEENVRLGVSGDEVALAGKGFNEDVEKKFKDDNPDLDYTWVDWMEKIVVTPEQSQRFLAEGKVQPQLGGEG
jgi:uncharacterized protein YgiM (DUF1202 family)